MRQTYADQIDTAGAPHLPRLERSPTVKAAEEHFDFRRAKVFPLPKIHPPNVFGRIGYIKNTILLLTRDILVDTLTNTV